MLGSAPQVFDEIGGSTAKMEERAHEQFLAVPRDEKLDEPSWVLDLVDYDEPPLFTRYAQIEFLRCLEPDRRVRMALKVALSVIEQITAMVNTRSVDQSIFCCVTFWDFAEWEKGVSDRQQQ